MGLLEATNHLNANHKVTVLDGEYVILEEKYEQCVGLYRVLDFTGRELLFRAKQDTDQKVMTTGELHELANGKCINRTSCTNTKATGPNSTALGQNTIASGRASTAMGLKSHASGMVSFAVSDCIAAGPHSVAMGLNSQANGRKCLLKVVVV